MSWAYTVVAGLSILAHAILIVLVIRKPLLGRLALRETVRRRWQSAIVISGLMIGTGAILGPQVWLDSTEDSLAAAAYRSWGRVDLTVSAGGGYFSPDVAARLAADPDLAGSIAGVQGGIELVGSVVDLDQRLGKPTVQLVGFDPANQKAFGAFFLSNGTRTYGDNLATDAVLLSRSLADSLEARVGDRLLESVGGSSGSRSLEVRVAGIVNPEGPGAYGLRPSVFSSVRTAQMLTGNGLINVVRISARGDGQAEIEQARKALPSVRTAVRAVAGASALEVRADKLEDVDALRKLSENNRPLFVVVSLFVVAVGAALVVNLALALAEERRPRFAVLRALGLSRRALVALSVIEGALYSLAAALVGILPGVVIAWVMLSHVAAMTGAVNGREGVIFQPAVRPATVAVAIAAGALITLSTLFFAAIRSSRMTIASAIRDLPEPVRAGRGGWLRIVVLGVSGLAGLVATMAGNPPLRLLGGVALIAVASAFARKWLQDRVRGTVTGLALTAWTLGILLSVLPKLATSQDTPMALGVMGLGTVVSVFGLTILLSANLRLLEGLAGLAAAAGPTLRATLRPPLAFLTRRPLRTGLATGAFALAVAMVTVLAVLADVIRPRYELDSGGYDVVVSSAGRSALTLPAEVDAQVARKVSIPTRAYIGPVSFTDASGGAMMGRQTTYVPLYELPDEFIDEHLVQFNGGRAPGFSTDMDVWRAVKDDPSWVIASFSTPGGTITLNGSQGPVRFKIGAQFAPGFLVGISGSHRALAQFAELGAGSTILVKTLPGANPSVIAHDIRRSLVAEGVEANTTHELLYQGQAQGRAFSQMFTLLMQLGLVVGLLSLGILALRAVVERRRTLGVLRALGYQRGQVMAGIIAEGVITATLGAAAGMAVGVTAMNLIIGALEHSAQAVLPEPDVASVAGSLVLIYTGVLLVTLAVTSGPALRASQLAPVEALRLVD